MNLAATALPNDNIFFNLTTPKKLLPICRYGVLEKFDPSKTGAF